MRSVVILLIGLTFSMTSIYTKCKDTCFNADGNLLIENGNEHSFESNRGLIGSNHCEECNSSMYVFLGLLQISVPLILFASFFGIVR